MKNEYENLQAQADEMIEMLQSVLHDTQLLMEEGIEDYDGTMLDIEDLHYVIGRRVGDIEASGAIFRECIVKS